jgi:heavy metal sensor kinase
MKIKRFRSLAFKLTVWYIAILAIIVVLAGIFLYQGFKESLVDELDGILLEIADETNETWRGSRSVSWDEAIRQSETKFAAHRPYLQLVEIAEDGERRVESVTHTELIAQGAFRLHTHLYYRADKSDIDNFVFETVEEETLTSYPIRVFLLPVRGPNVLQVGISMESTMQDLNRLLIIMVLAGIILLVFASLGGSFIINRALHPVKSVVKTAQEITAEDLSLRITAQDRRDEIGALVETFNAMIARLEKSVNKIKQFSGDVSHELRTPLTIIRGEIEVLLRKDREKKEYVNTLDSVLEESHRMEKIIDDLLFLSRVEAMDRSKFNQNVRLDEVLTRSVAGLKPAVQKKKLRLELGSLSKASIRGDQSLLERMVVNLLENAIRYTPSGGRIHASLERTDGSLRLEIRDTGIGIPQESLPFIFDRFYVADQSRSKETGGSGLGLSIVKWIAENHRAHIDVQSRQGEGTTFHLNFPLID